MPRKSARRRRSPSPRASRDFAALRTRLAYAEEALRAVRNGEVDAVIVSGNHGSRVFTLAGADHAYRVLIETMNEGALAITGDAATLTQASRMAAFAADRAVAAEAAKVRPGTVVAHEGLILRL